MRLSLNPHPDTPCEAVRGIEVEIFRPAPGALLIAYELTGTLGDLSIPQLTTPARADRLWQHSCFEAFVRPGGGEAYWEFNFAPSGEWAAYRLDGYRSGMTNAFQPRPPRIDTNRSSERLRVAVDLETSMPPDGPWKLGLSAVIEDRGGERSFWALAHPPGPPDFHSPDCFAIELAPPPGS